MKPEIEMLDEELLAEDTICSICNAEFLDSEDLTVHKEQMHSLAPKYCQFCPDTHTDLMDYAQHVKDSHLSDLRCCSYCTKAFLVRSKLKIHESKHVSVPSVLSCSQCTSTFPTMGLLELHERENHYNEIDGCFLQCMPYLSSLMNLKAVSLLQSAGKLTYKCVSCKYSSSNLSVYTRHLVTKKCTGYVCDKCSTLFKSKRYLMKHVKRGIKCSIGEETDGLVTKCKNCNTEFLTRVMHQHLKSCNILRCVDCNLICKNIDELSEHQTKEHPLDMTVIRCKFCLKEFIGKVPLKKHIYRVHRPSFHLYKYKCSDCDVIFKHPQKLFAHFYTKHKDLEPFTCKICDKKFRVRKSFSLHIKLDHKSVGFVEFDNQYHVFFTANKSQTPFIPACVVPKEMFDEYKDDTIMRNFSIRSKDLLDIPIDVDSENDRPLKRKKAQIKTKATKSKVESSSDEEPLLEVRKRVLKKKANRRLWCWKKNKITKSQFTCNICDKNCYTFQNHQNHMSLHNENQAIECVKCSKRFNSKEQLKSHISKEHATSKLTETLKNLLEKKKQDVTEEPIIVKKPEKFTIAMKKVASEKSLVSATIKPVDTNLNVKNFLENFTPELSETPKANIQIDSLITAKYVKSAAQETKIKLTKFKDEPKVSKPVPLKMPERFKHDSYVKTKITVKLVEQLNNEYFIPESEHNYSEAFQDDKNDDIPEVAHEVSLVGTEEPSQSVTRIVIPKMPKGYSKIHIATLQPEAPYFKIIKVDSDNLTEIKETKIDESKPVKRTDVIDLPGGTKLVTANPLAHLLGDGQLDKLLEPAKKKYYKPVIKDFSGMLAQAMQKLEDPPKKRIRKAKMTKTSDDMDVIE